MRCILFGRLKHCIYCARGLSRCRVAGLFKFAGVHIQNNSGLLFELECHILVIFFELYRGKNHDHELVCRINLNAIIWRYLVSYPVLSNYWTFQLRQVVSGSNPAYILSTYLLLFHKFPHAVVTLFGRCPGTFGTVHYLQMSRTVSQVQNTKKHILNRYDVGK